MTFTKNETELYSTVTFPVGDNRCTLLGVTNKSSKKKKNIRKCLRKMQDYLIDGFVGFNLWFNRGDTIHQLSLFVF